MSAGPGTSLFVVPGNGKAAELWLLVSDESGGLRLETIFIRSYLVRLPGVRARLFPSHRACAAGHGMASPIRRP